MAASFLNPHPQPGDGAFLLQSAQRRGRGRTKLRSFLRQEPDEYEFAGETYNGLQATNQLPSFLPSAPSTLHSTSLVKKLADAKPRTIADNLLLSPHDPAGSGLPPAPEGQLRSFLIDPSSPQYTIEHQDADATPTMASARTNKSVPPHLRKRPTGAIVKQNDAAVGKSESTSGTGSQSIRAKLTSDFGVKVSDQTTATAQSSSAKQHARQDRDATKPVPLTSARNVEDVECAASTAIQAPDSPPTRNGEHVRGRGRGRGLGGDRGRGLGSDRGRGLGSDRGRGHRGGRGRGAQHESKWPKSSEVKADPNHWDTNWGSEKNLSIDSAQADGGFGDGGKRAPLAKGEWKLTDWEGNWTPAPLDWDARPAFRDPEKLDRITEWMLDIDKEMCGLTHALPAPVFVAAAATKYQVEAIPRYWVPIAFPLNVKERISMAPQTFWNNIISKDSTPDPMDKGDLDNAEPWWKLLDGPNSSLLQRCPTPEIKGISPDENLDERLARENDDGADKHAQNRINTERAKQDAKRARLERAEAKARKYVAVPNVKRIKPGLNMYVRSARPTDMVQLRDIYNHYVDFACCIPECERRTTSDMTGRYRDILANRLPFLVACERGGKVPARRKKRNPDQEDLILPDRVVGFAYADDYNDMTGMYRFTAEVEVYVSKQHYMQNVAKCLMDKLMALLDPEYIEHGGFDIQGEELEGVGVGAQRVISDIVANVPYDKPDTLEWKSRWLISMGFVQKGNLEGIGNKLGKSVSLAIFCRKTGATIDATKPPINMGYPS